MYSRHVEAQQLDAEGLGQLARGLGLAGAGGAGEQVAADRLVARRAGPARAIFMAADSWWMASSWPNTAPVQVGFELLERLGVGLGDRLRRDAGDLGDHRLDLLQADRLLAACFRAAASGEAPASSMMSIALSGSLRSVMYLADSSTAALSASAV